MALDHYHTLGRSGLRVSPLALGTMTFGQEGWGCDAATASALLDQYFEAGGNFVDTADFYAGGASETMLGEYLAARGNRDAVVVSTKFSLNRQADPNSAGNGRKAMIRSLEGSLARLGTDYIDLYFMHAWDGLTPVEEVMRGLDDLVRSGKVRYVALSDSPSWYVARAQTLAEWRGFEPLCGLQLEYSLVERSSEWEYAALAQELGVGIVAWSPLGSGVLSGKYRAEVPFEELPEGRLKVTAAHTPPSMTKFSERNFAIITALEEVADKLGATMPQVAINWVANRPGVGAVVLGATKASQLGDNLGALDFTIPAELGERLDEASAPTPVVPYALLNGFLAPLLHGGITRKHANYSG